MLTVKPYYDSETKKFMVKDMIVTCKRCKENFENLMCVKFDNRIILHCINCEVILIDYECKDEFDNLEVV